MSMFSYPSSQTGSGSGNNGAQSTNPQHHAQAGPEGNAGGNAGNAASSGNSGDSGLPAAVQNALADCEIIVSKAKALHEIYQKLLGTGARDAFNIEAVFSSFLQAVDDHDQQERGAAYRGGEPSALERPGGRSSALEAQFPWTVADFIESSITSLSPNLTETLRVFKLLLQYPNVAKCSITTSPRCPEFPDSEWTNLVNGRPVNLDAVHSGVFSPSTNDERSESLEHRHGN
ncbi:hypothetical protein B0H13DRAFT_2306599 [Mycena leptocephala]|nr:hypothetical protein B0H13DRAFT_2306599 [Mycena leptocephala]